MRTLYHWPLDPQSRQARIALTEKKLKFKLAPVSPWEPDAAFMDICIEGTPPALVDVSPNGKIILVGTRAICEYAHESSARFPLLSDDAVERAEARRLCAWFDVKFQDEVNAYLMHEKIEKSLTGGGAPDPTTLRAGREHLAFHLDYITWLLERREWLAGPQFSLADIAAGAHVSCLDFLGEIPWKTRPVVKTWYQKLKCRPGFRPLLADKLAGIKPPLHYADLDF